MTTQSAIDLRIEVYSEKSFVVRGGATREYKDSLKALGGKWNSRLNEKESDEKFGAWLFWKEKTTEVTRWLRQGCPVVEGTAQEARATPRSDLRMIEERLERIERLLQSLVVGDDDGGSVVSQNDAPKPRRLLGSRR